MSDYTTTPYVPPATTTPVAPPQEAPPAAQTTDDLLRELVAAQTTYRAEVAQLREMWEQSRLTTTVNRPTVFETPEQRQDKGMAEIAQHSHYCPACGRLSKYLRDCSGKLGQPHPTVEMVSTEELLSGDPATHTPGPVVKR